MNDSDKNLGAVAAEKKNVIMECTRQLYDISTYFKVLLEDLQVEILIAKITMELLEVVNTYTFEKGCKPNGAQFLLCKTKVFSISTFLYIIWKVLKILLWVDLLLRFIIGFLHLHQFL